MTRTGAEVRVHAQTERSHGVVDHVAPSGTSGESAADALAHTLTGEGPPSGTEQVLAHAPVPAIARRVLDQSGDPLDGPVRAAAERLVGHDLSHVRVHRGESAAASADAVRARAWSAGPHVVLGAHAGDRALAHELGHVVAGEPGVHRDPPPRLAPSVVQPQQAWFATDEVLSLVRRTQEALDFSPPQLDLAVSYVEAAFGMLDTLVTGGRADVAQRRTGQGVWTTVVDARNAVGEMNQRVLAARRDLDLRGEKVTRAVLAAEVARLEFAVPYLRELEESVSYELSSARDLPDVPTRFSRLTRAQAHVLAWLTLHRGAIAGAAARARVDRRAVAGAIAWEATEQVKTGSFRGRGPGKVHVWEFTGTSAAEEAVALGNVPLPPGGLEDAFSTLAGSLAMVAGIMAALADVSERHGLRIRDDPGVLTTVYQGWSPIEWGTHLAARRQALGSQPWPRPVVANPMGVWTEQHLPYLEEAVGFSVVEKQKLGEPLRPATPEGVVAPPPP